MLHVIIPNFTSDTFASWKISKNLRNYSKSDKIKKPTKVQISPVFSPPNQYMAPDPNPNERNENVNAKTARKRKRLTILDGRTSRGLPGLGHTINSIMGVTTASSLTAVTQSPPPTPWRQDNDVTIIWRSFDSSEGDASNDGERIERHRQE